MPDDRVSDEEELYRRVQNKKELFRIEGGVLRFSSSAFNDKGRKPSVDRATLRESPHQTKHDETDGVTSLIAHEIRGIAHIAYADPDSRASIIYNIDVYPRPMLPNNPQGEPENLAHAQIESSPEFHNESRFKKLKEALAILASKKGWVIQPS